MLKQLMYFILIFFLLSCGSKKEQITGDLSDSHKIKNKDSLSFEIGTSPVIITTSDNILLKGVYYFDKQTSERSQPLIILIHQFNSSKEQWKDDFIDSLLNKKYKVLTFDIRGHGESGKPDVKKDKLLSDIEQTPKDIDAVISWVKNQKGIDFNRIGVIGTSIGATLGLVAKYNHKIKTVIGISGGKYTFENLTGNFENRMSKPPQRIVSVLFICGDKDGDYAFEEKYIMDNYIGEPKEFKIYRSDKHGKDLINEFPEIYSVIYKWLENNL